MARSMRGVVAVSVLAAVAVLLAGCGEGVQGPGGTNPTGTPHPTPRAGATPGRQGPSDYSRLVLADGDRVRASGRVVAVPHRPVRFCAPVAEAAVGSAPGSEPAPQYCDLGVDVTGVDLSRLSQRRAKGGVVEGYADVEGVYHAGGDRLTATAQHPQRIDPGPGFTPDQPPCPAPAGGWPAGGEDANLGHAAVEDYGFAHPGSIVLPAVLRPSRRQVLAYALTAGDPAPVEAALRPTYGSALCVVRSRYTRAQIDHAAAVFVHDRSTPDAGILMVGGGALGPDEQVVVDVGLARVTPAVAALAARQPPGLVYLHPWLHAESVPVAPVFR